jgi:hypothetical protein
MQVADSVFVSDSRTARMTAGLIIDPDDVRQLLADLLDGMVHDRELVSRRNAPTRRMAGSRRTPRLM